ARPGVGHNLSAAKRVVDGASDRVGVRVLGQTHLELRHSTDGVQAARSLKEFELRVDKVLLGRRGLEDASDRDVQFAYGKSLTRCDSSAAGHGLAYQSSIAMFFKFLP